ncbi:hypothetical protein ACX0G9_07505 [Flavitalea flava]
MTRIQTLLIAVSLLCLFSCSRSVTPGEAANRHYGRCRDVR